MSLTYPEVGGTAGPLPVGYHHLRRSRVIGSGRALLDEAGERLMRWEVQRGAGLRVEPTAERVAEGVEVRVGLPLGPVALTAPCRVVYVVDEPDRRGFAYGTLPGHPERGEELFLLHLEPGSRGPETVRFEVVAFSVAAQWWSRLGGPVSRVAQRRIAERYLRALGPPDC